MGGQTRSLFSLDWRWIVAGYCYLILFHLLPTYLMGGSSAFLVRPHLPGDEGAGSGLQPWDMGIIWLLAGVLVVAFVVGWKSRGFTILEPAVSGALYALTTALAFHQLATPRIRERAVLAITFLVLIVIILSVASAWVGETVQRWRLRKNEESSNPEDGR
ncbi:MAG: hypothetical protein NTU47_14925 [Ignavibacteriales bacterium]|nr:hypothetical protein [Ignavibacteriales bacterium]